MLVERYNIIINIRVSSNHIKKQRESDYRIIIYICIYYLYHKFLSLASKSSRSVYGYRFYYCCTYYYYYCSYPPYPPLDNFFSISIINLSAFSSSYSSYSQFIISPIYSIFIFNIVPYSMFYFSTSIPNVSMAI